MSNLLKENKSGWEVISPEDKDNAYVFADDYIKFMNSSKTEREVIKTSEALAKENGFKNFNEVNELHPGDKVYYINREKNIFLAVIGEDSIEDGFNLIGAHADSPRLDLKPNPLIEKGDFAYFKTHYYGGIKKYQWTTIPLSIHGVIIKENGEKIDVNIGENDDDPIFTITDLLPHLDRAQSKKPMGEAIDAENLNLVIGNIPVLDDKDSKEKLKENVMRILNQKYGITEYDFLSSELEIVPAFKARSSGFDSSMVAAYGQDDKVCVYASLRAILETNNPKKTAICIFSDKEEIGSMGNTGMQSHSFDTFVSEILNKLNINRPNLLDKVLNNSKMLSADVDGAVDPLYDSVSDLTNNSFFGHGIVLNKYTGAGGKYEASDANAEYVSEIRNLFNANNIKFQVSELGKQDVGGGGTIAYILANKGLDVIDCGIPILSMHSPYELSSKYDIYMAFKAYKAFLNR